MPILPRQLGIQSLLSEAIQSRLSTASEAFFSTPVVVAPTPTVLSTSAVPTVPVVQTPIVPVVTQTTPLVTQSVAPATSAIVSQTPTVSVIVFTTTTTPLISTTPAVTSSSDIISSTTPISSLVLTSAPAVTNVPTTSRSSASASASGASANASGANAGTQTDANKGISGGIIALIVVGALLVVLLVGAFTFRRVQVYRRAKRRENNYGAGPVSETAPFPFTNVSETDLKGAEPIARDFRQGATMTEKPIPSVAPTVQYGASVNSNFGQPGFNNAMSGPYPTMGPAAGYRYAQPGRTASPAPSQAPRMMSPAPPPAALMRTASPALSAAPSQYPQSLTPAPAPLDNVPPHLRGKKRVVQTFQPTLPDELDIREGDFVTVVHAYDDGWALCERNGRRGVVPLECLDLGRPDFRASRRLSSLSAIRQ